MSSGQKKEERIGEILAFDIMSGYARTILSGVCDMPSLKVIDPQDPQWYPIKNYTDYVIEALNQ